MNNKSLLRSLLNIVSGKELTEDGKKIEGMIQDAEGEMDEKLDATHYFFVDGSKEVPGIDQDKIQRAKDEDSKIKGIIDSLD